MLLYCLLLFVSLSYLKNSQVAAINEIEIPFTSISAFVSPRDAANGDDEEFCPIQELPNNFLRNYDIKPNANNGVSTVNENVCYEINNNLNLYNTPAFPRRNFDINDISNPVVNLKAPISYDFTSTFDKSSPDLNIKGTLIPFPDNSEYELCNTLPFKPNFEILKSNIDIIPFAKPSKFCSVNDDYKSIRAKELNANNRFPAFNQGLKSADISIKGNLSPVSSNSDIENGPLSNIKPNFEILNSDFNILPSNKASSINSYNKPSFIYKSKENLLPFINNKGSTAIPPQINSRYSKSYPIFSGTDYKPQTNMGSLNIENSIKQCFETEECNTFKTAINPYCQKDDFRICKDNFYDLNENRLEEKSADLSINGNLIPVSSKSELQTSCLSSLSNIKPDFQILNSNIEVLPPKNAPSMFCFNKPQSQYVSRNLPLSNCVNPIKKCLPNANKLCHTEKSNSLYDKRFNKNYISIKPNIFDCTNFLTDIPDQSSTFTNTQSPLQSFVSNENAPTFKVPVSKIDSKVCFPDCNSFDNYSPCTNNEFSQTDNFDKIVKCKLLGENENPTFRIPVEISFICSEASPSISFEPTLISNSGITSYLSPVNQIDNGQNNFVNIEAIKVIPPTVPISAFENIYETDFQKIKPFTINSATQPSYFQGGDSYNFNSQPQVDFSPYFINGIQSSNAINVPISLNIEPFNDVKQNINLYQRNEYPSSSYSPYFITFDYKYKPQVLPEVFVDQFSDYLPVYSFNNPSLLPLYDSNSALPVVNILPTVSYVPSLVTTGCVEANDCVNNDFTSKINSLVSQIRSKQLDSNKIVFSKPNSIDLLTIDTVPDITQPLIVPISSYIENNPIPYLPDCNVPSISLNYPSLPTINAPSTPTFSNCESLKKLLLIITLSELINCDSSTNWDQLQQLVDVACNQM